MKETLFNYPEYARIGDKKYKINTDYRIGIKCNDISLNDNIPIEEKTMAIIYLLFGEEALNDVIHYEQFIEKAYYFLNCGKTVDIKDNNKKEPDMDLVQDFPYIVTSFRSDYNGFDLNKENLHWWDFYYMLTGLSQSEMGNSCILNRIRDLRNLDLSKIKDPKERERLKNAKEQFALKKHEKKKEYTQEEINAMEEYHKLVGD